MPSTLGAAGWPVRNVSVSPWATSAVPTVAKAADSEDGWSAAQQPAAVGQADPVTLQGHDVVVGDQPQHPPERVLVGADGCCQLWYRQRPGGQSLGDLQPGDRAQAMPQQAEVDHLGQGLTVSGWVTGHVRSFKPRIGTATPARVWVDLAILRFGESQLTYAMQQQPLSVVVVEVVEAVADTLCSR